MPRIEKSVFISYRRTNIPWALNVYQDLTHHGYDVFFDYEGYPPKHRQTFATKAGESERSLGSAFSYGPTVGLERRAGG